MPRRYTASGFAAVGTNLSLLSIHAKATSPTTRQEIEDLIIGCAATPADQATNFEVQRSTATGTQTSFTPVLLDPAPGFASEAQVGINHTAEPTYTANSVLLRCPLNQRATFRWVAAPGYALIVTATANNGIGVRSVTATGSAIHQATAYWIE